MIDYAQDFFKAFQLDSSDDEITPAARTLRCVFKLNSALVSRKMLVRPPNLRKWADEFWNFWKKIKDKPSEFERVLDWHIEHIDDPYAHICLSASAFCEKYEKIRAAKQRHDAFNQKSDKQTADVKTLKSMPYADYLKTDHWAAVKKAALKYTDFKCQLCNSSGVELHTHHRTYERLGEELPSDVTVLCSSCHEKFHDIIPAEVAE